MVENTGKTALCQDPSEVELFPIVADVFPRMLIDALHIVSVAKLTDCNRYCKLAQPMITLSQ